jgi:DNA-binding transcriptional LysR family regulator
MFGSGKASGVVVMDVRQLRIFIAIAEEGSIHAGARRMMMEQPPASQALRRLERAAGGELFVRSPRGVQLTEAGSVLLEHAREIVARLDTAVESVRAVSRTTKVPLRLGLLAGMVAAGDLTWPIIRDFRRRYPEVELQVRELSFDAQFDAVLDGSVDVAVLRGPFVDERIEVRPIFAEPRLLCCTADHPLAEADLLSVAEIVEFPVLEMVRTPSVFREFWRLDDERGGPPPLRYAAGAVSLLDVQLALLTESVVMPVGASAWTMSLRSSPLRAIPLLDVEPSPVAVGYPLRRPHAYATAFADCARTVAENAIGLVPGGTLLADRP